MKKLFLFAVIVTFSKLLHAQQNDTIFLKSGDVYNVYKVAGIENNFLMFYKLKSSNINKIDTTLVARFRTQSNELEATQSAYENALLIEGEFNKKYKDLNEMDYQRKWIQYNLNGFYREKRLSQICYGLSFVSTIVWVKDPINNGAFMYLAGGLGLASFIIDLDSYKWIKRASIEPTLNGLTLKLKL